MTISLILSRVSHKMGQKWEILEQKTPDHPQVELGLSHMCSELGSNPQLWDDKQFRVLKISILNNSDKGAVPARCNWKTIDGTHIVFLMPYDFDGNLWPKSRMFSES